MRRTSVLFVLILSATFATCTVTPRLPTAPRPNDGVLVVCEAALLTGVLAGNPSDPNLAWLINANGLRSDVMWPAGFSARFSPNLEVVAPDGTVVARAGDFVRLGGGFAPNSSTFGACEVNGRNYLP